MASNVYYINKAADEELQCLPGIGPKRAQLLATIRRTYGHISKEIFTLANPNLPEDLIRMIDFSTPEQLYLARRGGNMVGLTEPFTMAMSPTTTTTTTLFPSTKQSGPCVTSVTTTTPSTKAAVTTSYVAQSPITTSRSTFTTFAHCSFPDPDHAHKYGLFTTADLSQTTPVGSSLQPDHLENLTDAFDHMMYLSQQVAKPKSTDGTTKVTTTTTQSMSLPYRHRDQPRSDELRRYSQMPTTSCQSTGNNSQRPHYSDVQSPRVQHEDICCDFKARSPPSPFTGYTSTPRRQSSNDRLSDEAYDKRHDRVKSRSSRISPKYEYPKDKTPRSTRSRRSRSRSRSISPSERYSRDRSYSRRESGDKERHHFRDRYLYPEQSYSSSRYQSRSRYNSESTMPYHNRYHSRSRSPRDNRYHRSYYDSYRTEHRYFYDSDDDNHCGSRRNSRYYMPERRGNPKSLPKSLRYDGNSSWLSFKQKFESYMQVLHWSESECRDYLNWSLEGKALDFFTITTRMGEHYTFPEIMRKLESRFGAKELTETARARFQQASQQSEESLEDWADRCLTLATTAFRDFPEHHRMQESISKFCQGCTDKDAGKHACFERPKSMSAALNAVKHHKYISQAVDGRSKSDLGSCSGTIVHECSNGHCISSDYSCLDDFNACGFQDDSCDTDATANLSVVSTIATVFFVAVFVIFTVCGFYMVKRNRHSFSGGGSGCSCCDCLAGCAECASEACGACCGCTASLCSRCWRCTKEKCSSVKNSCSERCRDCVRPTGSPEERPSGAGIATQTTQSSTHATTSQPSSSESDSSSMSSLEMESEVTPSAPPIPPPSTEAPPPSYEEAVAPSYDEYIANENKYKKHPKPKKR